MKQNWILHQSIHSHRGRRSNGVGRRAFVLSIAAAAVNGCSTGDQAGSPMLAAVKLLWNGTTPKPVDRAYVANLPYASMLARLNEGPWALLVLATGEHEGYGWYSAERQMIATAGPWIIRTIGLEKNIDVIKNFNINPYNTNIANIPRDFLVIRWIDSVSMRLFDLEIQSYFENRGIEEVEILDHKYQLSLVVERGQIPALDVNFENRYWVDPATGYCWRSEQSFLPDFVKITYEIAKPPAR